jgi:hypothetical protein
MRRLALISTAALILSFASLGAQAPVAAPTDGGYRLVPNWPTLPPGDFFGLKNAPPPPAEREAQAAARRARGETGSGRPAGQGPTNQPGISGLAIDQQDRIYVFNRGAKPVMVFNTDGKLIASGGDQDLNGKKLDPNWQHSGAVDWEGNVYMIERDAHRIVKMNNRMDTVLLQLGTTMEKGNDDKHFDLPSGIAVLKNGNIVVTTRTASSSSRSAKAPAVRRTRGPVRASGCCRTSSPSMRRRTCTSSIARIAGCRSMTRT